MLQLHWCCLMFEPGSFQLRKRDRNHKTNEYQYWNSCQGAVVTNGGFSQQNTSLKRVDSGISKSKLKKPKRIRTAFTTEQILTLEEVFKIQKYVDRNKRNELVVKLGLSDRNIKVWFQNRRMKNKKDVNQSDTDSSIENTPPVSPSNIQHSTPIQNQINEDYTPVNDMQNLQTNDMCVPNNLMMYQYQEQNYQNQGYYQNWNYQQSQYENDYCNQQNYYQNYNNQYYNQENYYNGQCFYQNQWNYEFKNETNIDNDSVVSPTQMINSNEQIDSNHLQDFMNDKFEDIALDDQSTLLLDRTPDSGIDTNSINWDFKNEFENVTDLSDESDNSEN